MKVLFALELALHWSIPCPERIAARAVTLPRGGPGAGLDLLRFRILARSPPRQRGRLRSMCSGSRILQAANGHTISTRGADCPELGSEDAVPPHWYPVKTQSARCASQRVSSTLAVRWWLG